MIFNQFVLKMISLRSLEITRVEKSHFAFTADRSSVHFDIYSPITKAMKKKAPETSCQS